MLKKYWNRAFELIKYGFWGVVTTLLNLALYFVLIRFGIYYLISNVLSYIIAVIVSYFFNNFFVFNQVEKEKISIKKIFKYFLIRILSLGLDSALLYGCVSIFHLNQIWSKLFVSFLVIMLTYLLNKKFVFTNF